MRVVHYCSRMVRVQDYFLQLPKLSSLPINELDRQFATVWANTWARHVAPKWALRSVYRVLVGGLPGKRPIGQPRRRLVLAQTGSCDEPFSLR